MNPHNAVLEAPTTYNRQVFLIFGILVAGKTSGFGVEKTRALLDALPGSSRSLPFRRILLAYYGLEGLLREIRTGRYGLLAVTFRETARTINVDKCTIANLQSVPGIGPKTANYFMMYGRGDRTCAAIDTHMKKFLRECGCKVGSDYMAMQRAFVRRAEALKLAPMELDAYIWQHFARGEDTGYSIIMDTLRRLGWAK